MPLSPTLTEGLDSYGVGKKIREMRVAKKLGLVELGRHTGLSAALLSKIECGKMYPTLPTLLRIALCFGVGLEHFFNQSSPVFEVVRREDRKRFPERPDAEKVAFDFESLDFPVKERRLHAYLAKFHPTAVDDIRLHRHAGIEFIYILQGKLGLYICDAEVRLSKGDSVYFDSDQLHGYRQLGRAECQGLAIIVPPSSTQSA